MTEPLFLADLAAEASVPRDGILSRTVYADDRVEVVLFAFDAGQRLSAHTAAVPAIIQILDGEAEIRLGEARHVAGPRSFVHLPARLEHAVVARTPLHLLLILLRAPEGAGPG